MTDTRQGRAVRVGSLEIVPVEKIEVRAEVVGRTVFALGMKYPVAVVVRTAEGEYTVRLDME